MSTIDETDLAERLNTLRSQFDREGDVIAVWEAIGRIIRFNTDCERRGTQQKPIPAWMAEYLATCSDKIERLWLGIDPKDERPGPAIPFNEWGALRQVRESDGSIGERNRDRRGGHVAEALGLVRPGWSAFALRDRLTADRHFLDAYDDPAIQDDSKLKKEVQTLVIAQVKRQMSVDERAVRNRLSKARKRQRQPQK